jgi:hypothetical protein
MLEEKTVHKTKDADILHAQFIIKTHKETIYCEYT